MAGDTVYSNNDEDFDWDDPHECLQDWFDNLDESDHPDVWTIYHGIVTNIELIEPEGSFRVSPRGKRHFRLTSRSVGTGVPEWCEVPPSQSTTNEPT